MDVLIVGAGIAGATLAYWLRRAGHCATLVEKSPMLREGGYLIDFWGAGFEVADRMGIVEEVMHRGLRFERADQVDRHGAGSPVWIPRRSCGGPATASDHSSR